MEIKNKKAFTLLEVLLSIILLSIIVIVSVKAYTYFTRNSQKNIIDYMALAKIDSEMNRLVYAYENLVITDFTQKEDDTLPWPYEETWKTFFTVPNQRDGGEYVKIYTTNPLKNNSYGLDVNGQRNTIEIIDKNNNPNIVDNGDIVGLLGWKLYNYPDKNSATHVYLSLSITYPFVAKFINNDYGSDEFDMIPMYDSNKTINLKTITHIK